MATKTKSEVIRFVRNVSEDLRMVIAGDVTGLRAVAYYCRDLGLRAVVRYRIANLLYRIGLRNIAWCLAAQTTSRTGADIAPDALIGPGLKLPHPAGVVIGHGSTIGRNCTILQGVTLGERYARASHAYPELSDFVTIGAGAKLLGGIIVGAHARIGANSVVLDDVPPSSTVVGMPARVASRRADISSEERLFAEESR